MNRLKNILFILLILYIVIDHYAYYYGVGNGFLSKKIPAWYYLDYGTFDQQDPSVSIMDRDLNLFLMHKDQTLNLDSGKRVEIKKLLGYYFNSTEMIVKVLDKHNQTHNIRMDIRLKHIFTEESKFKDEDYRYINLENNKANEGLFTFIINIILLIIVFLSVVIIISYVYNIFCYFRKIVLKQ